MSAKKRYRILITSNEPWGDIWFSKQHYANELAKLGHEVFFLNAPNYWSARMALSNKVQIEKISKNLSVVNYHNPLPLRGFKKMALWLNDKINEKKIYLALPPSDLPILWWKFDPFRFAYLSKQWRNSSITELYHITDPFDHIFSDSLLAQKAQLVVTVLRRYQEYYAALNQKPVLYIPHGISADEFHIDEQINTSFTQYQGSILKIGTINDYYNIQLLIDIATHFNDKKLVVVGPNKLTIPQKQQQFQQLKKLANVVITGPQKATMLKYYVHNAAVCIVPYDFQIESLKGTPLKVLNYLAQGKVSITSIATDLEHLLGKGLIKSDQKDHFIASIANVLNGKIKVDQIYLNNFFNTVSYPVLIEKIFHELNQQS
ncbi:glycosyltransferase [Aureispira anguillae]|uniref:Glycosyltransferase n=1 Tax=Aureispira anguillae TaxID=2864201 RepID=A0A916DWA1_9BACT|nr:glycosyltransferase [Aureispira anguillae]BDS15246.1 glycosyltransferase [Aureispira anguillae]